MNLIDKYLGEAKYIPNMKYDPEKFDKTDLATSLLQTAKVMKGRKGEITANVAWAMQKNDKKKIKKLIDMYGKDIIGGQGTINQIIQWMG